MPQLLIFTDLDGTLLDHHSYSFQAALPALEQIKQRQIPLILCTSKTAAEVAQLRQQLGINSPFIVENGTSVLLPPGKDILTSATSSEEPVTAHFFGKSYPQLLAVVQRLRQQGGYRFQGFNDFSVAELAADTGLGLAQAGLAKKRLSSEPLRWDDSEVALQQFTDQLGAEGLQLLRGGRYYHVLSAADKGTAVDWLLHKYREAAPETDYFSVALGDGPNDKPLLEAVDLGIVIPSATGLPLHPQGGAVRRMEAAGPVGWNRAILDLLHELDQDRD